MTPRGSQGFAWGMGVDGSPMIRRGYPTCGLFCYYDNELRFLRQF